MSTQLVLLVLIDATAISALLAAAWALLAQTLLRVKLRRPRLVLFIALFVVIQWVYNFALFFYPGDNLYWFIVSSEVLTFTLQCALMVGFIYGQLRKRFAQTLASVALAYFLLHAFLLILLNLAAPLKLELITREYPNMWAYIGVNLLLDVPPYLAALGYAHFLRFAMRKSRFTGFYQNLFTSRFKAAATCVVCVLLMHSARIVTLLFPEATSHTAYYVVVAFIDILFLLFLLFVAAFETNRLRLRAQAAFIAQQQGYLQTLERLQKDVRAFRHDYQNMMSGLWLQAQEGDLEGVQQRVKSTLHYFDDTLGSEIKQAGQVASIEILELKSLVTVKLMEMQQRGVAPYLEVVYPVQTAAMETEDLLRCLGILLDNAIEAAEGLPGGWVRLALLQEGADLLISVSNPVAAPPALHEMAKRGYTTKGAGRGIGLASLREIVHHYPAATTKTVCEKGEFRQELHIHHDRRAAV